MIAEAWIAARRLHTHHLWGPPLATAEDVVEFFGAMQAQEFVPAKWSIAQRAADATDGVMTALIDDGVLLRTHVVRPTWHFVLAEDLRRLLAVTGPRVHALNAYQYRALGLDDEVAGTTNGLIAAALAGGRQMTRTEIGSLLAEHGIPATGLRLGYVLMRAELDAVIVSGAPRGRQHTYALFDDRVPAADPVPPEEALADLTLRYFRSRGPATVRDYVRWSSLTVADARAGLSMVGSQLERTDVAGRTYWSAHGTDPAPVDSPRIDLIQAYDEYVMSYSESRDVMLGQVTVPDANRVAYLHTILVDGRLAGHWKHTVRARKVIVDTYLYHPLDERGSRAMDAAVRRFGMYFDAEAIWR
ncbi:MAG TPA: winged helix DNA-binding domain-containing protein [Actinoplanes sp.]|jgi:hypothetical protein